MLLSFFFVYRPEKDHAAQLRSLKEMFDLRPNWRNPDDNNSKDRVRLVMIGSARDSSDEARVESLKQLAKELGILVSSISLNSSSRRVAKKSARADSRLRRRVAWVARKTSPLWSTHLILFSSSG